MITEYNDISCDLIDDEEELYREETEARTFQMTVKTFEENVKAYLRIHNEDNITTVSLRKQFA